MLSEKIYNILIRRLTGQIPTKMAPTQHVMVNIPSVRGHRNPCTCITYLHFYNGPRRNVRTAFKDAFLAYFHCFEKINVGLCNHHKGLV
jgi:hypothetical protein